MVSKHSGIRGIFDTILVNRYKNLCNCCIAMDRKHELKFKWKKVEKKNPLKKKAYFKHFRRFFSESGFFSKFYIKKIYIYISYLFNYFIINISKKYPLKYIKNAISIEMVGKNESGF